MNSSRASLVLTSAFLILSAALYWRLHSEGVRNARILTELQSQVETQSQAISSLQAKVEDFENNSQLAGGSNLSVPATSSQESQLGRVLAELVEQRSNLLALIRSSGGLKTIESREEVARRTEAAIATLEQRFAEQQKKQTDAYEKLDRLRVELNVPDDVATVDFETAVYNPRLTRYRPYFEARRTCDELRRFTQILNLKLASERLDASLPVSTK